MKRVLIISPYFPPVNAADMQRVRMSLPYFVDFGWQADVVTVNPAYVDMAKDEFLSESVPPGIKIHQVNALNKSWTYKFKLGSIALRSLWFYKKKVNQLLVSGDYDLIYFSTTQFAVCVLGPYWKRKFGTPYVIDMQDPWHSDYYKDKPKEQRPPKYWASYRLNKYQEAKAMQKVDGLISVSDRYTIDLKNRYSAIKNIPTATIPFGASEIDFEIANKHHNNFPAILDNSKINIVCIGRGGIDLYKAIAPVFKALATCLQAEPELYNHLHLAFIGTSYAPPGQGKPSILPLAETYGVTNLITEHTDRISYYHSILTLQQADGLFIPGSDDTAYTPSKIYPYLAINKPLLGIFHPESKVINLLKSNDITAAYSYQSVSTEDIQQFLSDCLNKVKPNRNASAKKYSARQLTMAQCQLFDKVLSQNPVKR